MPLITLTWNNLFSQSSLNITFEGVHSFYQQTKFYKEHLVIWSCGANIFILFMTL